MLAMAASGFAGLGYQIVWTQQSALWLGHEAAAVLAVVTAFFGGLSLGALLLGRPMARSRRPHRWYAACELTIAMWGLLLAGALAPVSAALLALTGVQPGPVWQWAVAFCGTFVVLLPATAAMGATLPAMDRVLAQLTPPPPLEPEPEPPQHIPSPTDPARWLAALYACNTAGAVAGVLAAAFWLVPRFGLVRTAAVCAGLNLCCAAVAFALRPAATPALRGDAPSALDLPARRPAPSASADGARWLGLLAATGLLGIGYEVLAVRVISQLAQDTVYTFALLLAVYLVGTAIGAAAYQRVSTVSRRFSAPGLALAGSARMNARNATGHHRATARPRTGPDPTADRLLQWLAAACLLGSAGLWAGDGIRDAVLRLAGPGMAGALAAEAALALVAFALPTVLMGALFSHLATQAAGAGIDVGRALGVNTLGAAAAPLLFGVLALPALGAKGALLGSVAAYLALAWRGWRAPTGWPVVMAVGALAVWAPPLVFVDLPDGGRIVSYREGPTAAVSVVEDAAGTARLRIDNRQQEGSSASVLADARQAWLPLLLHPAPHRALFLGLGTGVTAASAAEDPALQVDAVELLPEVIAASASFRQAFDDGASAAGRLHVLAADARRFVRTTAQRYDVVVSDNFHPARSGSGALYTVEHFRAVRGRLADGGLFCQWLPLHQLDRETLRSIVQSFLRVYPAGAAMLATNSLETPVLGLLARADDGRFELRRLRERLADRAALPPRLAGLDIADEFALLGGFVAGPRVLARFAGDAPLNTDDHPVVAYGAPRITYAADSLPRERLAALLAELDVTPAEVIDSRSAAASDAAASGADAADPWPRRMAAYWSARDRFLAAGQRVRPTRDVRDMLAQVHGPLLSVLRLSPDFRPAYDPLLRMAGALSQTDAPAARALLSELAAAQPARPEALEALRQIEGR